MTKNVLKPNRNRRWIVLVALLSSAICSTSASATISAWHFANEFSTEQQSQMKTWLTEVQAGLQRLFGPPPDQHEIHLKRQTSSNTPVPWAHTAKGPIRAVHFYVDTSFSPADFREDWTAAHELTHMLFPYVGEDRWFAEGLASYLQYQVMYAAGHIEWDAAAAKIKERFHRVERSAVPKDWSVLKHNANLEQQRDYPRLYWGGAAYFARVDRRLWETTGTRFTEIVREYTQCCYSSQRTNAMDLLDLFDQISETKVFAQTYQEEMQTDGTPDTRDLSTWLQQHPPKLEGSALEAAIIEAASDSFPLYYRESGTKGNPLVVFVHGTPGTSDAFEHLLNHAALQACCHLIAIDRLGFGKSAASGVQPSFETQANAIAQVFEHNQSTLPVTIVGHSLGGSIAAKVAMQFPQNVGALLIISSALDPNLSDVRWYQRLADLPLIKHIIPEELHRANEEMLTLKPALQSMVQAWQSLSIPVTIIQGNKDRLVPNQNPAFAESQMQASKPVIHRFEDDGHFILWERPDFIVQQTLGLIEKIALPAQANKQ